jgi:aminoglycoside 3-N-acetyltransferase I
MSLTIRRLVAGDEALADALFGLMSRVLDDPHMPTDLAYRRALLRRRELWIVAAFSQEKIVGGLTAHALPMTRAARSELFIYDLAVDPPCQRRGIGRALIEFLREHALVGSTSDAFVLAEADDDDAIAFYRAIGGTDSSAQMFVFVP